MQELVTINTPNKDLNRIQRFTQQWAQQITPLEILDGRLIEGITLSTTETKINHKLGRNYKGWIIVNKNAAQDVYVSSTTTQNKFLNLTAGGTVTVSLWVF